MLKYGRTTNSKEFLEFFLQLSDLSPATVLIMHDENAREKQINRISAVSHSQGCRGPISKSGEIRGDRNWK